uniref:Uncharacterized protein n=1 Tax=Desertifilum tharense IPPAS B-1220 TaxID=1781255 RepID=A0ACD5GT07_9CYAN
MEKMTWGTFCFLSPTPNSQPPTPYSALSTQHSALREALSTQHSALIRV